jgi:hypothetical protein
MTWEEMLAALHALIGQRVVVWADHSKGSEREYLPGGFRPLSPLQISGILRSGKANELIERIRDAVPAVLPGDEVLSFVLGGDDTEVDMTLTKSLFEGAYRYGPDEVAMVIQQGDLKLTIADQERLLTVAERLNDE